MIEQGLVAMVQGNATVAAIANEGGFLGSLPPDQPLPSWRYLVVSRVRDTGLQFTGGLVKMMLQIDCYANDPDDVVRLAGAIDDVLEGFRGRLSDPNSTYVDSCFRSDEHDHDVDPNARNFRRQLEYEINFAE